MVATCRYRGTLLHTNMRFVPSKADDIRLCVVVAIVDDDECKKKTGNPRIVRLNHVEIRVEAATRTGHHLVGILSA